MLQEANDSESPLAVVPPHYCEEKPKPDPALEELMLIKRLHRLSKVSWSPTLRANSEALKNRARDLERAARKKSK